MTDWDVVWLSLAAVGVIVGLVKVFIVDVEP